RYLECARHMRKANEGALEVKANVEMAAVVAFPLVDAALIERRGQGRRIIHAACWHCAQIPLASIMVRRMVKPSFLAASPRSMSAWPASNSSAPPHCSQIRKMVERSQAPTSHAMNA